MPNQSIYIILIIIISSFLHGCAGSKNAEQAFVGRDSIFLRNVKGPWQYSSRDSGGTVRLTYIKERNLTNPKFTSLYTYTSFYIDKQGIIRRYTRDVSKKKPAPANHPNAIE